MRDVSSNRLRTVSSPQTYQLSSFLADGPLLFFYDLLPIPTNSLHKWSLLLVCPDRMVSFVAHTRFMMLLLELDVPSNRLRTVHPAHRCEFQKLISLWQNVRSVDRMCEEKLTECAKCKKLPIMAPQMEPVRSASARSRSGTHSVQRNSE